MKAIFLTLLALTMFIIVSCEKPDISGIVVSKSFTRGQNGPVLAEDTLVNSCSPDKYYLHIRDGIYDHPIEVKKYFWELTKSGDSIFVYGDEIKLKKSPL